MKSKVIVAFAALGLVAAVAFAQNRGGGFSGGGVQAVPYANSYALVVGIDAYSKGWPRLDAAVSDARAMTAALQAQGFKVYSLTNAQATKTEILKYLSTVLPPTVKENDRFLFYFAGHGQTETMRATKTKMGYAVPFDGSREGGEDAWHTYISMDEMNKVLTNKYLSRHVMLAFDSCFAGLALTRSGGVSQSVQSYLKKQGVTAITAGGEGELARDGLFTRVLVSAMSGQADRNNDGYVTFGELALYTEQEVNRENSDQMPRHGSLRGEGQMVFVSSLGKTSSSATPSPAPTPPVPTPTGCAKDNECKGDRVCENGQCVSPPERAPQGVAPPPPTVVVYQPPAPSGCAQRSSDGRYCDHGDGTITDSQTGLMWAKSDSYASLGKCLGWDDSRSYVSGLRTGGHANWRMPSVDELKAIFEEGKSTLAYDNDSKTPLRLDSVFSRGGAYGYWSSEEAGACCARSVGFTRGGVSEGDRAHCGGRGVRAVRRGQ
ncbi:MAG: caspase family protein [Deltaproteobacteria bacterium]|nr:caspase family protein [Deltaproteobacteria bacterium]